MATGGGMKEFAIARLGDAPDRFEDYADKVIRMSLKGYPMFKRVGVKGRGEESMRNIPLYMSADDIERIKKMPVYFLTRDIGLAYLFHQIDYLDLQSYGYMIQCNAGKTGALVMNRFNDCEFGLGPKWTRLDKTDQELEITLTRAAVESSRVGRDGHFRFTPLPVDETSYSSGCKILETIKVDTIMFNNCMGHGLAMMNDLDQNQKKLVSGSKPGTYILYITPGRDEVIEISMQDLESLIPDSPRVRDNEHYGLAFLFECLYKLGVRKMPRGCKYEYDYFEDTQQQRSRTVVAVEVICYDEDREVYNLDLTLADGNSLQQPLRKTAYDALQELEVEMVEESLTQFKREGIKHWSQTAISLGPNVSKARRDKRSNVSFNPQIRDDEPDVTEYRVESEQQYVQEAINEKRKAAKDYFEYGRVWRDGKNCCELLEMLKKQVEEQRQAKDDAALLKQIKEKHFELLKNKGREHHQKLLDMAIKQNERYPSSGDQEERSALQEAKEKPNSYMSYENADQLWTTVRELLRQTKIKENEERAKGMDEAAAKLKAAREVFRREGISRITLIRNTQVNHHIDGRCKSVPCIH